jgi:hypothetical protein
MSIVSLAAVLACGTIPNAPVELPADLALLPEDTCALVCVHPAELLAGEVGKSLREMEKQPFAGLPRMLEMAPRSLTAGIPLAEVERLTVFVTETELYWMITTLRPLDRARVLRQTGTKAAETKLRDLSYHAGATSGVLFVNDRTFLTGPSEAMAKRFARAPAGAPAGLLGEAIREAAGKRHLVGAFGGPRFKGGVPQPLELPNGFAMLKPLLRSESALAAFQFDKEFRLDFRCTFGDEGQAEEAATALGTLRRLGLEHLPELGEVLAECFASIGGPRQAKDVLGFFEAVEPGLKGLRIEREGKALRFRLRSPGRGALWALLMLCMPGGPETVAEEK